MPGNFIEIIMIRAFVKVKNIRKEHKYEMVMSHVWKDVATRDHLHLVDILKKTLFFVFNARAIADQIVEVVINLTCIVNAELAP